VQIENIVSQPKRLKKPVNSLKTLIKKHKLIDNWRDMNTNLRQYTRRRENNISTASRIDYFFVSTDIRSRIVKADIRPATISYTDHQAMSLKIKINHNVFLLEFSNYLQVFLVFWVEILYFLSAHVRVLFKSPPIIKIPNALFSIYFYKVIYFFKESISIFFYINSWHIGSPK
jgi:hypothetical protein